MIFIKNGTLQCKKSVWRSTTSDFDRYEMEITILLVLTFEMFKFYLCFYWFLFIFQVTVVVLSVIIFAILGELYTERGSMLSTAIFVYAITSPVNGYSGGGLYARMGGRVWIKQMLVSAFLLPAMVCGSAFFINFIAMYYHASRAIPFSSMVMKTISLFLTWISF